MGTHTARFKCDLCPQEYTQAFSLRNHLRTHTDERPFVHTARFKCHLCPQEYTQAFSLRNHLRTHTDERLFADTARFKCHLCPRKYTRSFTLRNHLRTHTDERPFVCGVCGKAFTRKHDCKSHEQLHNGTRTWICRGLLKNGQYWGCNKRYGRKSNLTRHFGSHSGRECIKLLLAETTARLEIGNLSNPPQPSSQADAEHTGARSRNIIQCPGLPSAQPDIPSAKPLPSIRGSLVNVDCEQAAVPHKERIWP